MVAWRMVYYVRVTRLKNWMEKHNWDEVGLDEKLDSSDVHPEQLQD